MSEGTGEEVITVWIEWGFVAGAYWSLKVKRNDREAKLALEKKLEGVIGEAR